MEAARLDALDTRSFIMRKPELEQTPPVRSRPSAVNQTEDPTITSRMVQARYDKQISSKNNVEIHIFMHINCHAKVWGRKYFYFRKYLLTKSALLDKSQ